MQADDQVPGLPQRQAWFRATVLAAMLMGCSRPVPVTQADREAALRAFDAEALQCA